MNKQHEDLLCKIVAEVKELLGIEIKPNYAWIRDLTEYLIGYFPDECVVVNETRVMTDIYETTIAKHLGQYPLLYHTLLKTFLARILCMKEFLQQKTNSLLDETKNLVDYKIVVIDKILTEIQLLEKTFISVLLDNGTDLLI